jgi:uncharacterized protein DUF6893
MNDIRISPVAQIVALAAIVVAILAGIAANFPEVKRYLNVRKM